MAERASEVDVVAHPHPADNGSKGIAAMETTADFLTTKTFAGKLPWTLINSGIVIAVVVIVIDLLLSRCLKQLKLPIMIFAFLNTTLLTQCTKIAKRPFYLISS